MDEPLRRGPRNDRHCYATGPPKSGIPDPASAADRDPVDDPLLRGRPPKSGIPDPASAADRDPVDDPLLRDRPAGFDRKTSDAP